MTTYKSRNHVLLSLSLSIDARLGFLVSMWRHDYLHYQSSLYGVFQRQGLHCHTHTSKRFRFFGSRCHDDGVNRSLNNGGFGAHRWNRQLFFADVQIEIIWSDDHCWQGAIPLVWFSKALKGDQKNASTSFFKRIWYVYIYHMSYVIDCIDAYFVHICIYIYTSIHRNFYRCIIHIYLHRKNRTVFFSSRNPLSIWVNLSQISSSPPWNAMSWPQLPGSSLWHPVMSVILIKAGCIVQCPGRKRAQNSHTGADFKPLVWSATLTMRCCITLTRELSAVKLWSETGNLCKILTIFWEKQIHDSLSGKDFC